MEEQEKDLDRVKRLLTLLAEKLDKEVIDQLLIEAKRLNDKDLTDFCWRVKNRYFPEFVIFRVVDMPKPNYWNRVWEILVDNFKANDRDKESFISYMSEPNDNKEFRFCGILGFGGKLYKNCNGLYVSYYAENSTPELEELVEKVNKTLKEEVING
jgi:hypothetical protein